MRKAGNMRKGYRVLSFNISGLIRNNENVNLFNNIRGEENFGNLCRLEPHKCFNKELNLPSEYNRANLKPDDLRTRVVKYFSQLGPSNNMRAAQKMLREV